jgi:hypothetical protein
MKRIAAPMIGGVISSFLLELLVYPVIYEVWRRWELRRLFREKITRRCDQGLEKVN